MTVTSFEVGSVFKIIDDATPTLKRLSTAVGEFNKLLNTSKKSLLELGNTKFPGLETSLKALGDQAAAIGTKMDATLRSMVVNTDASIASVDRLARSWEAVAAATATAASAAARASVPATAAGAIGGRRHAPGFMPGGGGLSYSPRGVPVPGGHFRGGTPAMLAAGAVAGGLYEYAELARDASRAVWAMHGGNMPDQATQEKEKKQYIDTIMDVAGKTGKSFKDLSAVAQSEVRQSAGVPWDRRMQGLGPLLTQAASEADLRGSKYPPAKPGAYMRLRKSRVFLAAFCPSDNCLCQGRRAFGCLHSWHDGPSLLGRAERSTPEARRVAPQARGVDGESARRAIIVVQWIASRGVLPSPSRDASRASS